MGLSGLALVARVAVSLVDALLPAPFPEGAQFFAGHDTVAIGVGFVEMAGKSRHCFAGLVPAQCAVAVGIRLTQLLCGAVTGSLGALWHACRVLAAPAG